MIPVTSKILYLFFLWALEIIIIMKNKPHTDRILTTYNILYTHLLYIYKRNSILSNTEKSFCNAASKR